MGWAGGSEMCLGVWRLMKAHVPKPKRVAVIKKLIRLFEDADCDTLCEVAERDEDFAKVYDKMHPPD